MSHPNSKFMKKYLAPLIGCVLTEVKTKPDGFVALVFAPPQGGKPFECELSSDEEGNAPGFLFGLPTPRR